MFFDFKISINPKLEETVEDPTALGRYLGDDYFSFFVDEGNVNDVYHLERNSGAKDLWTKDEIRRIMNFSSVNLIVFYNNSSPVGYLAYTIKKERVSLWNITVHKNYRLKGLGAKTIRWLASEYDSYDISTTIREQDLASQIFLRQTNFVCTKILKNTFASPEENGYFFTRLAECLR